MSLAKSSGFVSPAQMGSPMPSHQTLGMGQIPAPQMNTSSPYLGVEHAQPSSAAGSVYEHSSSIVSSLSPTSHPSPSASNTDAEDDGRVLCARGQAMLQRSCTVEQMQGEDGLLLTLRHPGGGFRRLRVTGDGRGVVAADGAEPAKVAVVGPGDIEVTVGEDRYRLPATIKR